MSSNPAASSASSASYNLSCTSPSPGPFVNPHPVTPAPATPATPALDSSNSSAATAHRKKILILYTGGTMGMRPSHDGSLAPEAGYLTERIKELPELSRPEMPLYEVSPYIYSYEHKANSIGDCVQIIEYDPLIDSSCMTPNDWIKIAKDVETYYDEFDGFVVIMGTDTMAYASSALSFMLENLTKPVVFTGSQIPFYEVCMMLDPFIEHCY
jgi:L-asparaginase/Glu-tRNA(Gln) amidotransferase subunit D